VAELPGPSLSAAISDAVLIPLMASMATLALNLALWRRLFCLLILILSFDLRHPTKPRLFIKKLA
jgi:hypothetical protein